MSLALALALALLLGPAAQAQDPAPPPCPADRVVLGAYVSDAPYDPLSLDFCNEECTLNPPGGDLCDAACSNDRGRKVAADVFEWSGEIHVKDKSCGAGFLCAGNDAVPNGDCHTD